MCRYSTFHLKGPFPTRPSIARPAAADKYFDLVINLKTAKTLGVIVPRNLQVAADEVIE